MIDLIFLASAGSLLKLGASISVSDTESAVESPMV